MQWDPSFSRKSALFWPIARAAALLGQCESWPRAEDLTRLFVEEPPVHFELALPKPRRGRAPAEGGYDARIVTARRVPTRERSWHDVLNALVWATFPHAKLALHERQHRLITARLGEDRRMPSTRTKEQDALAMLDEGGVVVLYRRDRRAAIDAAIASGGSVVPLVAQGVASAVIFGHAIYEGLACGRVQSIRAAAYPAPLERIDRDAEARVRAADRALAALLARPAPIGRGDIGSLAIDDHLARASEGSGRAPLERD
jgi:hypothetical protein